MRPALLAVFSAVVLAVCSPVLNAVADERPSRVASVRDDSREWLRGLKGIGVTVAVDPKAEAAGLRIDSIKDRVEVALRKAGIPVLEDADRVLLDDGAVLMVRRNALVSSTSGEISFVLSVSVGELVALQRDRERTGLAFLWRTGGHGIARPDRLKQMVVDGLDENLNEFLNDYLAVNPRTP